jgi:hypothetical protein
MLPLIANYTTPRKQIRSFVDRGNMARVAFLEGRENIGKSYLLASLRPEIVPAARYSIVDFLKRRGVPTPIEILAEIAANVGVEHFPRLDGAMQGIRQRAITADIRNISIEGSYNKVEAIAAESDDERLFASITVTNSFLADIRELADHLHPLILAFDGYDAATPLIDKWFHISLVPGLCAISHIRLIVSARNVPKSSISERASATETVEVVLSGINDVQDWFPIITSLKRTLPCPAGEQTAFLQGVIYALKGAPGGIMPFLMALASEGE